jgi:hypothetical protein
MRKDKDSGISEVLGFSLVLGVVIVALSIVFAHTYSIVSDTKETIKFESMGQGFRKIQNIVEYTAYNKNPVKSIRLLINEGGIYISPGNEIRVSVESNNTTVYTFNDNAGLVEYMYQDSKVAFENGGVWMKYQNQVSMISQPRIFIYKRTINNETVVFISLTLIQGSGSVSGRGFANLEIKYNSSETRIFNTSGYVKMEIDSEYSEAWNRYFENMRGFVNNTVLQTELNDTKLNVSIYYDKLVLTRYVLDAWVKT